MERKGRGVINAYILNLMTHADNLRMDEQEIRDKIEKRYGKSNKRIRPQHVRILHLEPLVKYHWLRFLPDKGKYERIGELRKVKPYETLHDQFKGLGLPEEYIDAYIYDKEFNRKLFGAENFEDSLTEEEYNRYMDQLYKDYIE